MKKLLLLPMLVLCFTACSVDNDGMEESKIANASEDQIQKVNLSFEIPGCDAQIFDFENSGELEVINDGENLYVSFMASEDFSLSDVKVHIEGELLDFPTVGGGNLPPGQMAHQESFDPGVEKFTFEFPLNDLGEHFLIAAHAVFNDGESSTSAWAGNQAGNSGGWSYFAYEVCIPCEPVDAGEDNSGEFKKSQVDEDGFEALFLGLLSEEVSEGGTFAPSIPDMESNYASEPLGTFTTTYTLGEGDCADSLELGIQVVCDPVNAGEDDSVTLSAYQLLNESRPSPHRFEYAYLSLLPDGVPKDGIFEPTMEQIVYDFIWVSAYKTHTTTYTIGEGECADSVELSITVVEGICAPLGAGADNSVTLTQSQYIDQIGNVQDLRNKYVNLLSDEVPENGTFSPTIDELANAYSENKIGTFSTTYTIWGIHCRDSAILSITVTADPDDGGGDSGGGGGSSIIF